MMNLLRGICFLLVLLQAPLPSTASPVGALECKLGPGWAGGHLSNSVIISGVLLSQNITINEETYVEPDELASMPIPLGEPVRLAFHTPDDYPTVKGFNVVVQYLDEREIGTSDFTILDLELHQYNSFCDADPTRIGITHTSNVEKRELVTLLQMDQAGEIVVDVTLVVQNSNDTSIHYLSTLSLEVVPDNSVMGVLKQQTQEGEEGYSTLVSLLESTGLDEILSDTASIYTLYAPNNRAFDSLDTAISETWRSDNYTAHLRNAMARHVVPQYLDSQAELASVPTLATGPPLSVTPGTIDQTATVVAADITADNGILHGIDTVLRDILSYWTHVDYLEMFRDEFSILLELLAASTDETLLAEPATLFAPKNDAWSAVYSTEDLEVLKADPDAVNALLRTHVAYGNYPTEVLRQMETLTMADGLVQDIFEFDGEVSVGVATINLGDIFLKSGMVQEIGAVLQADPSATADPGSDSTPTPTAATTMEVTQTSAPSTVGDTTDATIAVTIIASEDHTTLVDYLYQAELMDLLQEEGPWTLFAPTDLALSNNDDKYTAPEWHEHFTDMLLFHVTTGSIGSTDFLEYEPIAMANGGNTTITSLGPPPEISPQYGSFSSKVEPTDVEASNGVVHVIDEVLAPPSITTDIVDILYGDLSQFSTLLDLLFAAGIQDTLRGDGPFTLFAPTNDAFSALDQATLDYLISPEGKDDLVNVLTYHVAPSIIYQSDPFDSDTTMVNGDNATISMESLTIDDAIIIGNQLLASNGVIQPIDTVLVPLSMITSLAPTAEGTTSAPTVKAEDMVYFSIGYGFSDDSEVREPTVAEVEDLMCKTNLYFRDVLRNFTGDDTIQSEAIYIDWSSDPGSPYPITVNFTANVTSNDYEEVVPVETVFDALRLTTAGIVQYIEFYVWQTEPESVFQSVGAATFTYGANAPIPTGQLETVSCPETPAPTAAPTLFTMMPSMMPTPGGTTTCDICTGLVTGGQLPARDRPAVASRQNVDPSSVSVGDEITVEGYIMDQYCINLGRLLDAPDLVTLENPDKHTVHCLIDPAPCIESPFEVLLDPEDSTGPWRRGFTLDETSKAQVVDIIKGVGKCDSCGDTGTLEAGFRARMTAVVSEVRESEEGPGPVISVTSVDAVLQTDDTSTGTTDPTTTSIPSEYWNLVLPDTDGLTCLELESRDLSEKFTCPTLNEKYAYFCGCSDAAEPTCRLCGTGNDPENKTNPFASCLALDNQFIVQEESTCADQRALLFDDSSFDIQAYCCSEIEPSNVCGDLCPGGATVPEDALDIQIGEGSDGLPVSCRDLEESYPFFSLASLCDGIVDEESRNACCGSSGVTIAPTISPTNFATPIGPTWAPSDDIPMVTVDASFILANQEGLGVLNLTSVENALTLTKAFDDFVVTLVAETEGRLAQRLLRSSRQLAAVLQPNSPRIVAVQNTNCPKEMPEGSNCQNVFGQFDLSVLNEDPAAVSSRYNTAVDEAIMDGKLQESIEKVDPTFPWSVAGVIEEEENSPSPSTISSCQDGCEEGFFCSSATEQCETLTCAKWIEGVPEGNISHSEEPCIGEGAEPGTAFCGWDGNCYLYDCSNWYSFGPVEFTSYDSENPVDLVCSDYDDGYEENMNSITFGCRPYQPGMKAPEAISWTHFFNQECVANPRGSDEFKCYQNKADTNFVDFLGEVARLNPPSCGREIFDEEQPHFWYIQEARQDRDGEVINNHQGRENTVSSASFNEEMAKRTFFAVVVSTADAPEPTVAPTPNPDMESLAPTITESPTQPPTQPPLAPEPTSAPTIAPTIMESPTQPPTQPPVAPEPTSAPTTNPDMQSLAPTIIESSTQPSMQPSVAPEPTAAPTPNPNTSPMQSLVPTVIESPTQPSTQPPVGFRNCSACDGNINSEGSLPGGLSCGEWQYGVSLLEADSPDCILERALGVEYCGCPGPEDPETCHPCPGKTDDNAKQIPDANGLTCAALGSLVSVDNGTCDLVAEKYSAWCGCDDPPQPVCSFCEAGEFTEGPFIIPGIGNLTFYFRVFGHVADTSCRGFSDFYSVQTDATCDSAEASLAKNIPYDMQAWCNCSNAAPPNLCGDFCPAGSQIQENLVVENGQGLTCGQASRVFSYVTDQTICDEAAAVKQRCCLTPMVTVNASFVLANQEGLGAVDLAAPENAMTLTKAFNDFVVKLVAETEGRLAQRLLRSSRQLAAVLQPNSPRIVAVQNTNCPKEAPEGSTCQNTFGQFDLSVLNEDPAAVSSRYETAVDEAIIDGKLQESIDKVDPNYPWSVVGIVETDEEEEKKDGKMTWWLILLIVLASVFGCMGFCFLIAYSDTKRREKSLATEDEALMEESAKADASAPLLGAQTKSPVDLEEDSSEVEESGQEEYTENPLAETGMADTSDDASEDWEPEEPKVAVIEDEVDSDDELVEKTEERAMPSTEHRPSVVVNVEDDDFPKEQEGSCDGEKYDDEDDDWEEGVDAGGNDEATAHTQGMDPPESQHNKLDPPDEAADAEGGEQEDEESGEEWGDEDVHERSPVVTDAASLPAVDQEGDDEDVEEQYSAYNQEEEGTQEAWEDEDVVHAASLAAAAAAVPLADQEEKNQGEAENQEEQNDMDAQDRGLHGASSLPAAADHQDDESQEQWNDEEDQDRTPEEAALAPVIDQEEAHQDEAIAQAIPDRAAAAPDDDSDGESGEEWDDEDMHDRAPAPAALMSLAEHEEEDHSEGMEQDYVTDEAPLGASAASLPVDDQQNDKGGEDDSNSHQLERPGAAVDDPMDDDAGDDAWSVDAEPMEASAAPAAAPMNEVAKDEEWNDHVAPENESTPEEPLEGEVRPAAVELEGDSAAPAPPPLPLEDDNPWESRDDPEELMLEQEHNTLVLEQAENTNTLASVGIGVTGLSSSSDSADNVPKVAAPDDYWADYDTAAGGGGQPTTRMEEKPTDSSAATAPLVAEFDDSARSIPDLLASSGHEQTSAATAPLAAEFNMEDSTHSIPDLRDGSMGPLVAELDAGLTDANNHASTPDLRDEDHSEHDEGVDELQAELASIDRQSRGEQDLLQATSTLTENSGQEGNWQDDNDEHDGEDWQDAEE